MKKNDRLTVLIEGYSSEGHGVAKPDGFVLFVPGALDGEKIEVHVVKVNKKFGYAKILNVVDPSPHRVIPECEVCDKCGGCAMWHADYDEEKRFKHIKVSQNLKKAGVDVPVGEVVSTNNYIGYRNKAQYPVREQNGQIAVGFYRNGSHTVIEGDCKIQPKVFGQIANKIKELMPRFNITAYNETSGKGTLRHIYLRSNSARSEIMLCLVVNGKLNVKKEFFDIILKEFSQISTVCINYNNEKTNVILGKKTEVVYGNGMITDTLCGKKFVISPQSFYQVNHDGCELLYSLAKEYVKDAKRVLDLYCGIGTVGICSADKSAHLVGVEIVPEAIKNAKINAKLNGISDCEFYALDAAEVSRVAGGEFDAIIVDPPRKGCDKRTLDFIISQLPEKLVYISCDSATLARDLAILKDYFVIESVIPVDMFPKTHHIETVVCLKREKTTHKMKLNPSPFKKIKSGEKTIELRLFDEKRQKIKPGDIIIFTNTESGEKFSATVKKLHHFNSFKELYKSLPLLKCGYTTADVDKAHPSDMGQYYSETEQKMYGVVGIELKI